MPIAVGDIVIYHRDPSEAAAEAARQKAGEEAATKAADKLAAVEAALEGVDEDTRRLSLDPLRAQLNAARDAAAAWSAPTVKALVSFVHADGTVDVYLTGAPALVQRSRVPVGPQDPKRDFVAAD